MNFVKTLAALCVAALLSASTLNVARASALDYGFNSINTVSSLQAAANNGPAKAEVKGGRTGSNKMVKGDSRQNKAGHSNARGQRQGKVGGKKGNNQKKRCRPQGSQDPEREWRQASGRQFQKARPLIKYHFEN